MNFFGSVASAVSAPPPPKNWSTTLTQCEGTKVEHWLFACFCTPIAAACSKSHVDQSNQLFNAFCYTPLGNYNHVRLAYNIIGDCQQDLVNGLLCMPCGVRQMYSESSQIGSASSGINLPAMPQSIASAASNAIVQSSSSAWTTDLFTCLNAAEFCWAVWCPCVVSDMTRSAMLPNASEKWFNRLCIIPCSQYGQTRHTLNIGSEWPHPTCEDCAVGLFFYPCALNRANREAQAYQLKRAAVQGAAQGLVKGVSSAMDALKSRVAQTVK